MFFHCFQISGLSGQWNGNIGTLIYSCMTVKYFQTIDPIMAQTDSHKLA